MAGIATRIGAHDTGSDAWVHLRAGTCDFAVRVADLLVAIAMPATGLMPLPRRDAGALSGVVEFQGSAVPVVALGRWLPLGEPGDPASRRILVLRAGASLLGIEVDAVGAVRRIDRASIRRVHGDLADDPHDAEELFLAVAPAGGGDQRDNRDPGRDRDRDRDHDDDRTPPMLCLLDVGRLAALARVWCEEAQFEPGQAAESGKSRAAAASRATRRRCGIFEIGDELWAVDAERLAKVAATPVLELKWPGRRTCGICEFEGRKVPVVDLAHDQPSAAPARPWMAVLEHEGQWLGLKVSRCQQFLDLEADQVVPSSVGELSSMSAVLPGFGTLRLLDVDRLFAAVPEAGISRSTAAAATATAATATATATAMATATATATAPAPATATATAPATCTNTKPTTGAPKASAPGTGSAAGASSADMQSHYLVFEADRRYASPVAGVVGVVALSAPTIDDLSAGRRATVAWRGLIVSVVNMPPIDGAPSGPPQPRLAVIVEGVAGQQACTGIAIRSLSDWLPAKAAAQRGLHMSSVGDLSMVSSHRNPQSASLVVVDLAQMAYLLS